MDLPTGLLRDLDRLADSVSLDDGAVEQPLSMLVSDLSAAVPSYRGLQLTIVESGYPVSLVAFLSLLDSESITTSLRLPLTALGSGFTVGSRIVCYAATPGAFVDLAADLGHALNTPMETADVPPRPADPTGDGQHAGHHHRSRPIITLDDELPPATVESGLSGLEELSTINRAVGILIDQGHQPDHAHATLRRHAAAAGLQPHDYAARLLRRRGRRG